VSALPGYFRSRLVPLLQARHRPRCRVDQSGRGGLQPFGV